MKRSDRRPAPSATGTLDHTPLAHVLVYARNKRLTGILELLSEDGREGTVGFSRGAIVSARVLPVTAYFGGVAYELGLIDAEVLADTLHVVASSKQLHGEVLVGRGAITEADRDRALVEQMCRKVHQLFTLPRDTSYAFYEVDQPASVSVETLAPVWRGLRDCPPETSVEKVLERYQTARLRIVDRTPFPFLGLSAEERAVVEALEATPMTLEEMRASSTLRPARVDLVAYLLLISKCAQPIRVPTDRASDPGSSDARRAYVPSMSFRITGAPPPPVVVAPQPAPMLAPIEMGADAIQALAQRLDRESFYALLGLPEGATSDAARAAYFRLAKVWHPRHLPPELAWLHMEVQAIYERMSVAHKTLTTDSERHEYATSSRPTLKRDRGEMLRQIEHALTHRDFAFAEGTARALLESDPGDAEALALVAWALCSAGEGPDESRAASRVMLDRATSIDRHADRAFYFRGLLRKRSGDLEGAYRDFVRAVQANPKHVEAEREAKAYETRAAVKRMR